MEPAPASLHSDVARASSRARLAMYAQGCAAGFALFWWAFARTLYDAVDTRGYDPDMTAGMLSELAATLGLVGRVVPFFATLALAGWVLLATRNLKHLRSAAGDGAETAAIALCVPVVDLLWGFVSLRRLRDESAPDAFPAVRYTTHTAPENYRDHGVRTDVLRPALPAAPLAAWWVVSIVQATLWVLLAIAVRLVPLSRWTLSTLELLRFGLGVASAVLAILTIRAIDAAQRERAARVAWLDEHPEAPAPDAG